MGLFTAQVETVQRLVTQLRESSRLRILKINTDRLWPAEPSLVLEEDMGLELGNPKNGSLYFLLLTEQKLAGDDGVFLLGPDIEDIKCSSAPFAQVITVSGHFADEYQSYRMLRDAVYDTKLRGFMTRFLPSRGTVWCRITREALQQGLSLSDLGAAVSANLKSIAGVETVQIFFVTSSRQDLAPLEDPGYETRRIVGAMVKMNEEMSYDCSGCEYNDVCDTVTELRKYRRELKEKRP
jgi:CO dehydrogenase/acetyl-CoA synthase beta subunit